MESATDDAGRARHGEQQGVERPTTLTTLMGSLSVAEWAMLSDVCVLLGCEQSQEQQTTLKQDCLSFCQVIKHDASKLQRRGTSPRLREPV